MMLVTNKKYFQVSKTKKYEGEQKRLSNLTMTNPRERS